MNILLVDDEKKFVMMLARRLELREYKVRFVCTGAEAIELVQQGERFDAAVLDLKMPGIGGIELKNALQKLDPEMKFLFVTGHGVDIQPTAGANETDLYLSKPLKIDELVETLSRVCGKADEDTAPQS